MCGSHHQQEGCGKSWFVLWLWVTALPGCGASLQLQCLHQLDPLAIWKRGARGVTLIHINSALHQHQLNSKTIRINQHQKPLKHVYRLKKNQKVTLHKKRRHLALKWHKADFSLTCLKYNLNLHTKKQIMESHEHHKTPPKKTSNITNS